NIQQELTKNTVLQVGYVGSAGRKLFRFPDINQPSQAEITAADLACNCINDGDVPRPFDTAAPLSPLAPNQPFYVNELETNASSNYNSLQVSVLQRNWHRFTQQFAYTWSHSIDNASDGPAFVAKPPPPQNTTQPPHQHTP